MYILYNTDNSKDRYLDIVIVQKVIVLTLHYSINNVSQTIDMSVVGSDFIKGARCFLDQDTLPSLLSTGCFKERSRA